MIKTIIQLWYGSKIISDTINHKGYTAYDELKKEIKGDLIE